MTVGLVDANSFYASAERIFDPSIATAPICVLSNNDGAIVALTPEAKALGVMSRDVVLPPRAMTPCRFKKYLSRPLAIEGMLEFGACRVPNQTGQGLSVTPPAP